MSGEEAGYILEEDSSRTNQANCAERFRPEVAFVGVRLPTSGDREGLAGESARNAVSHACKLSSELIVECADIAEDGELGEEAVFLPLREDQLAVVVDLDRSDDSVTEEEVGEQSAAGPGEEVKDSHVTSASR